MYEGQNLELPRGLPKGYYYLHLTIDPNGYYQESDKKNNFNIFRIYIDPAGITRQNE